MKKIISFAFVLFLSTSYITPMFTLSRKCKNMSNITTQVAFSVSKASEEPKKGDIFRHYKGKLYEVIAPVARHSEDLSEVIVYKALYDSPEFGKNSVWVRPRAMFQEHVVVDGKKVLRFKKVDPSLDPVDPSYWMILSDSFSD
jgi:hypothetical protein